VVLGRTHRGAAVRGLAASMSRYLIDRLAAATANIELMTHTEIAALEGDPAVGLERVRWRDSRTGREDGRSAAAVDRLCSRCANTRAAQVTKSRDWRDPHRPKPSKTSAQGRNRTSDTRIFSPLLYQLSYLGKWGTFLDLGGRRVKEFPSVRPPW
jgi:hypothetical protein